MGKDAADDHYSLIRDVGNQLTPEGKVTRQRSGVLNYGL
jgi:hypothetical protein